MTFSNQTFSRIDVKPVTPTIGAEVFGVDLSKPLDDEMFGEVHTAFNQHSVLFFRDQAFDHDTQKAFGRRFGDLDIHPAIAAPEGHPEIVPIHADANSTKIAGERWHSDVSCVEEPPLGSVLYLHTVPEMGGDTLFSSMYAAYDALSDRMKALLEGLTARHDGEEQYRGRYDQDDAGKVDQDTHDGLSGLWPVMTRPVLCITCPKTLVLSSGWRAMASCTKPSVARACIRSGPS